MKDSFDNITNDLSKIINNDESILSKTKNLRDIFERQLKRMFEIPLNEYHPMNKLVFGLRNYPGAYQKKLPVKARSLNNFFNSWAHPNNNDLKQEEYNKYLKKLLEFISEAEEQPLLIINNTVQQNSNKDESNSNNFSMINSSNKIVRKKFVLSKAHYGKKYIICFTDKYGRYCEYDHDLVLEQLGKRITNLPCWDKYNNYTKTGGYPNFVIGLDGVK